MLGEFEGNPKSEAVVKSGPRPPGCPQQAVPWVRVSLSHKAHHQELALQCLKTRERLARVCHVAFPRCVATSLSQSTSLSAGTRLTWLWLNGKVEASLSFSPGVLSPAESEGWCAFSVAEGMVTPGKRMVSLSNCTCSEHPLPGLGAQDSGPLGAPSSPFEQTF